MSTSPAGACRDLTGLPWEGVTWSTSPGLGAGGYGARASGLSQRGSFEVGSLALCRDCVGRGSNAVVRGSSDQRGSFPWWESWDPWGSGPP